MLPTYAAIFQDNNKENTCYVSFPNLDYNCYISYVDYNDLLRQASLELGFALWLFEDSGKKFPKPNTISNKTLPRDAEIKFISCDYEAFKKASSVKTFTLSS